MLSVIVKWDARNLESRFVSLTKEMSKLFVIRGSKYLLLFLNEFI